MNVIIHYRFFPPKKKVFAQVIVSCANTFYSKEGLLTS